MGERREEVVAPDPLVRPYKIMVNCVPSERHFALWVEFRGNRDGVDWYSITDGFTGPADVLADDGTWAQEGKPWSHSPSWRKKRQFPLEQALEVAKRWAPYKTINGFTVEDGIRMTAERAKKR